MTALTDAHGRRIDYLRLSLTDRCDLRCQYCIPKGFRGFEATENHLTPDEIERLVAVFVGLGVKRVRLTGGEPLTRKGVLDIATRIRQLAGVEDLSLTTNGTQLKRYAAGLRQAGVGRLNTLFTCLGENDSFDLGSMVRSQASQAELRQTIQSALQCKPERHEFNNTPTKVIRVMSKTGG